MELGAQVRVLHRKSQQLMWLEGFGGSLEVHEQKISQNSSLFNEYLFAGQNWIKLGKQEARDQVKDCEKETWSV